jgi:hypothetical protein
MGWLFAVALGLYRQSRRVVLLSLVPIAFGHALAIAVVVYLVVGGCLLIGWGAFYLVYGHRHRVRIGLRTGYAGLGVWSFLMASAHGAGLMLIPALMPLQEHAQHAEHMHAMPMAGSIWIAALAVAVHTLAMLAVTGVVAVVVYDFVGLGFLRRGWVNLDLIWAAALIAMGLLLLLT